MQKSVGSEASEASLVAVREAPYCVGGWPCPCRCRTPVVASSGLRRPRDRWLRGAAEAEGKAKEALLLFLLT